MNILHISPYKPSEKATHAGGVLMAYEISELKKNNNVYVLYFSKDGSKKEEDVESYEAFSISKKEKIKNVLTHLHIANLFATRTSKKFLERVKEIITEYKIDAIHAEYAVMGQYITDIKKYAPEIRINLVLHDVTCQSYMRQLSYEKNIVKKVYFYWQLALIKKNEKNYIDSADNVLVLCDKDKELVKKMYEREDVSVINAYFDVESALKSGKNRNYTQLEDAICFFGQMKRSENDQAALRLVNLVNSMNIETKVYVIGNGPSEELLAYENEKISVTGFVEDPDSIMCQCRLAVFPLMVGAGIKIKVLHCLALGIPVITTDVGAEGIDSEGNVIVLAETDKDFQDAILKYKNDIQWQKMTGAKGMELIENKFGWEKTEAVFKKLYFEEV